MCWAGHALGSLWDSLVIAELAMVLSGHGLDYPWIGLISP